jgi:hypothetical protein
MASCHPPFPNLEQAIQQAQLEAEEDDPDDPMKTVPLSRYNTMLAILKNTLYIYGGIFETDRREFTLDDLCVLSI